MRVCFIDGTRLGESVCILHDVVKFSHQNTNIFLFKDWMRNLSLNTFFSEIKLQP